MSNKKAGTAGFVYIMEIVGISWRTRTGVATQMMFSIGYMILGRVFDLNEIFLGSAVHLTPALSGFEISNNRTLTLRRPLHRKLRMRWFFDISKVKVSIFFKSHLTEPPQIFDAHLLENTDLTPSRFHFSVGFISRSCFESDGFICYSNE